LPPRRDWNHIPRNKGGNHSHFCMGAPNLARPNQLAVYRAQNDVRFRAPFHERPMWMWSLWA
jgi:hypothetical protein